MTHSPTNNSIPLERKVEFLRDPHAYGEAPDFTVGAIETHMSWVFLTTRHAWKLKKPVWHEHLDFRSVAARHYYCEEELRLNRRLAPNVYLDVEPLCIDWRGHLHLGPPGRPIDWLVKMQRLAERDMLDHAVRDLYVTRRDILRLARCLTQFYSTAEPAGISVAAYLAGLEREIDANLRDLCRSEYGLSAGHIERLCETQRAVLQERRSVFVARVEDGHIVEGHGDLRPEHVCLHPQIAIIDCLEFSRELRLVDPIDELAFLTLELERQFASGHAATLMNAYYDVSGDRPHPLLACFYRSLRAAVRARLAIRHLDEERFRDVAEWPKRATAYLMLAQKYQDACNSLSDLPS